LRAATSLACLLRDQGRSADAVACLRLIYDRFTDGFDTADLIAAKRLLDQTGRWRSPLRYSSADFNKDRKILGKPHVFHLCILCTVVSGRQPLNRLARPVIFRLSNRRGGFKE
jgi:hypothetical protein